MERRSAPLARDCMTQSVKTVTPEMTLAETIAYLEHHRLSSAPVVEANPENAGKLAGFISEADCLKYLADGLFFGIPTEPHTVRTMMKRHPICVTPETDLLTLASVFTAHGYRHLPVVENGKLIGIVSRKDILRELDRYDRESVEDQAEHKTKRDLREIMNLRFLAKSE